MGQTTPRRKDASLPILYPDCETALERDASGQLREAYVGPTLQQFQEQNQPVGVLVFAVEVTALVHARAALAQLRAQGTGGPGASD